MIIKYDIKINAGEYAGGVIQLETTLDELENSTLADMLIAKGYLKCYCNADEFTILYRFAQIKHDDDQENNTPDTDCAICASKPLEDGVEQSKTIDSDYIKELAEIDPEYFRKQCCVDFEPTFNGVFRSGEVSFERINELIQEINENWSDESKKEFILKMNAKWK